MDNQEEKQNKGDVDEKNKSLSYVIKGEVKCFKCSLSYSILSPDGIVDDQNGALANENERVEQERTTVKKGLFLEWYEKFMTISATCKKIDISEIQVRRWKVADKEFAQKIIDIDLMCNEKAVDVLKGKVYIEHDGPSIRYYLDRKHPDFKPRSITEVVAPTTTMKQLVDEINKNLNQNNAGDSKQPKTDNEPGDHPVNIEDKKQEGGVSALPPKSCAEILLGKKDEKKLDTESAPKGN